MPRVRLRWRSVRIKRNLRNGVRHSFLFTWELPYSLVIAPDISVRKMYSGNPAPYVSLRWFRLDVHHDRQARLIPLGLGRLESLEKIS